VIDNLRMAVDSVSSSSARQAAIENVIEIFPVLGERRRQRAGSLSGGEQQMLGLARALAVEPRVIIADEMSLGLAPLVVNTVFERLERVKEAGITIVLIEQFVHRALELADHCAILVRGTLGWSGPAVDAGTEVLDRYLGENQPARDGAG
jgi:branched-chain amino acid transport system ATP-binding protein